VNRIFRLLPALGAFFVVAITTAGCGDSVPGNAVAAVDGSAIPKTAFDRWFGIAVSTSQAPTAQKVQYVNPGFDACVANKRKTAPKPAKGQPKTTDTQFKAQCKQEYESLRDQVMQFLILEKWISGEASSQGVKLSEKEADKAFEAEKKRSFPKEKDFQTFLKNNGMTVSDAKFQVRFNSVYTKLREKAVKLAPTVTDKAVEDFYAKNKARYATPATRDLRVVLTKTKAKADAALRELKGGKSWKAVANKYSIDQASKAQGGSLLGIAKGSQEKDFDDAIFAAKKGTLSGPTKTQFGYYVFQVQKITAAKQQPLKTASVAIKQQLDAQNKQKADDKFNTDLRKKWKAKTNCQDEYVMQQCKNYEAPKTTAVPPGQVQQAPPQQAPPQQAPPQPQP
jgi:foldase protein PrsA